MTPPRRVARRHPGCLRAGRGNTSFHGVRAALRSRSNDARGAAKTTKMTSPRRVAQRHPGGLRARRG
eukprot:CAMPEP_0198491060 /NCGR_PEP_ID=MMETSP1462-20131121/2547_1 /TAXON_ID=1333877 /ORGANISM="Brandtodinium nutriculum, Strain RCC3387" /LENGTH=66 /DNA_ID=CAMNT_0044219645 /DNA_START=54 /DNA_END=254 /DNA_ORIENTATION=-